ncbi:hypothetical protein EV126DRAFT_63456 [Verticillium dahliae]|nr:hypothetical protein EV126DRAFT_63456 [Verticillium dahliae]
MPRSQNDDGGYRGGGHCSPHQTGIFRPKPALVSSRYLRARVLCLKSTKMTKSKVPTPPPRCFTPSHACQALPVETASHKAPSNIGHVILSTQGTDRTPARHLAKSHPSGAMAPSSMLSALSNSIRHAIGRTGLGVFEPQHFLISATTGAVPATCNSESTELERQLRCLVHAPLLPGEPRQGSGQPHPCRHDVDRTSSRNTPSGPQGHSRAIQGAGF